MFNRRHFLRYSLSAAGTVWLSTALEGCGTAPRRSDLSDVRFEHGVASGDPQAGAVLLWTRAQPVGEQSSLSLAWEVANTPEFSNVLRRGVVSTDATRDYTVKVDVRDLDAGRDYYYRFFGASSESVIGRARTLPTGTLEQLRIGVFSCSNYPAGFFHPYR